MSKRDGGKFERAEKDYYPTIDPSCITEAFIERVRGRKYAEPCYGSGDLEDRLMEVAHCVWRSDIRKTVGSSKVKDATKLTQGELTDCDLIITNPPYKWNLLKPLLDHLPQLKPTWLLMPGDYMFNLRLSPYMKSCNTVIAVGRMYWFKSCYKELEITEDYIKKEADSKGWFVNRLFPVKLGYIYKGWWCPVRNIPTEYETTSGTSNMAWYEFLDRPAHTRFIGR